MSRTLKRVLGGIATGAGNYLVTKATEDAKTKREEILYRRELALKQLEHEQASDRIDQQGAWQVAGYREQGTQTRLNAVTTGAVTEKVDKNRSGLRVGEIQAEGKVNERLTRLRADLESRNDAAATRLKAQLENQNDPPMDVRDTAEGVIIIRKSGKVEDTGYKPVPRAESGAPSGLAAFKPGGMNGQPAPAAAPAATMTSGAIKIGDKTYRPTGDGGWMDAQGRKFDVDGGGNLKPR